MVKRRGEIIPSTKQESMFERMLFVYARFDGMKHFKAFDVNGGFAVDRLIYATLVDNSDENRIKLQKLADLNKAVNLKLQLRNHKGIVEFETK
jgi:hypothetical protein